VNIKGFFVTALTQALELTIATPDDVLKHVTPDLLAHCLPRPLWARLLTACLGAPRVDAQLVVETIGVPNLCEHIPVAVMWGCIREIAQRSLGQTVTHEPVPMSLLAARPLAMSAPPPLELKSASAAVGTPATAMPAIAPLGGGDDSVAPPARGRTPTGQRFRQASPGIGRFANASTASRRPQVMSAPEPTPVPTPIARADSKPIPSMPRSAPPAPAPRRSTDADFELETDVGKDDLKSTALIVEDDQFVEWAPEETVTTGEDFNRKR
jgi:hypothetical protein